MADQILHDRLVSHATQVAGMQVGSRVALTMIDAACPNIEAAMRALMVNWIGACKAIDADPTEAFEQVLEAVERSGEMDGSEFDVVLPPSSNLTH